MKKETTKQRLKRIRTAALTLASKRDLNSISIYDIAREASISTSTIYHHFPNIEVLLFDLMEEIFQEFETVLLESISEDTIHSWQDINRMIESGFVKHYNDSPLVQNVLFGQHCYVSMRTADAANDRKLGDMVANIYKKHFVLPELPAHVNVFTVALQIADKVYSMDHREGGVISIEMAHEAIVATESYLGAYLPKYLPKSVQP